jgi:Mg2+ and Co2+ transporter CorA
MIKVHGYILYSIFDKNIDLYNEYIDIIRKEYSDVIIQLQRKQNTIADIRNCAHRLISIISNLYLPSSEIVYICKLLLSNEKNNPKIGINYYTPYVNMILDYDKSQIGL